jgi:hypothetical protein
MMLSEMIHDVRIAKIGGKHTDNGVEQWMGNSVARWEGDTLVVETKGVNVTQRNTGGTFMSKDGTLTERFSRIGPKQILYAFEVNDPTVYASTWKGEMPLNAIDQPVYEYACHEGNYGLFNILLGGRQNDRAGRAQTGGENREE